jgi:hypothetical protein
MKCPPYVYVQADLNVKKKSRPVVNIFTSKSVVPRFKVDLVSGFVQTLHDYASIPYNPTQLYLLYFN